jgi:hypothetical protein
MRFLDAFFAHAAEVTPDGRCYILGGGFEGLVSPQLNIQIPALALFARIHFEPDECDREYPFATRIIDPNGNDMGMEIGIPLRPQRNQHFPELGSTSQVVISMHGMPIALAGTYIFEIMVDGRIVGQKTLGIAVSRND